MNKEKAENTEQSAANPVQRRISQKAGMAEAMDSEQKIMKALKTGHKILNQNEFTIKELMKIIDGYPEFKIRFAFYDNNDESGWPNLRIFDNIKVEDIGHLDKTIVLSGEEY